MSNSFYANTFTAAIGSLAKSGTLKTQFSAIEAGFTAAEAALAPKASPAFTGNVSVSGNLSYAGTLTGSTGVMNIGSGQIYKDASGNLGVGTTAPSYKLHVAGSSPSIVAGDNGANATRAYISATNAQVSLGATYSGGAVPIVFGLGLTAGAPDTERMRIDSSGNVAVGTAVAYARAEVASSGATRIRSSSSGANTMMRGFEFGITGAAQTYGSLSMDVNSGEVRLEAGYGGWGGFQTFWTNGAERMRIDNGGNQINTPSNTPPTLTVNGQMNLTPTSDTNMRISYRGSDGTTRVADITMA